MVNRPSRMFLWLIVALPACAVAVSTASTAAPAPPVPASTAKSVWAGVYTEAQAKEGYALYGDHCANCHGDELEGIEQAPALVGTAFGETWNGATLKKLFDRIETMPPSEPKSLSAKQYTDVLAYLLSALELPAGTAPLAADPSALAEITFTLKKPQP